MDLCVWRPLARSHARHKVLSQSAACRVAADDKSTSGHAAGTIWMKRLVSSFTV